MGNNFSVLCIGSKQWMEEQVCSVIHLKAHTLHWHQAETLPEVQLALAQTWDLILLDEQTCPMDWVDMVQMLRASLSPASIVLLARQPEALAHHPVCADLEDYIVRGDRQTLQHVMERGLMHVERHQHHLKLEQMITRTAALFTRLTSEEEMRENVPAMLREIGEQTKVDYVFLRLLDVDTLRFIHAADWQADGRNIGYDPRRFGSLHAFPWVLDQFRQARTVHVPDVDRMPPEAHAEQRAWQQLGFQSMLAIPLLCGENLLGYIGMAAYQPNGVGQMRDIRLLKLLSDFITSLLVRQRAVRELRETEQRWQYALEGSGDGVWDWDALSGKGYYAPRVKEILGIVGDDPLFDLVGIVSCLHPDDREQAVDALQRHLRGEVPQLLVECRVICCDRSYQWVMVRGKIIEWTTEGEPKRMVGTVSDISERKRIEEQLVLAQHELQQRVNERTKELQEANAQLRLEIYRREQAEDRYRAIVHTQQEFICRWLPDGTLTFANDAYSRYFGLQDEDLIGSNFMGTIPSEDRAQFLAYVARFTPEHPRAVYNHRVQQMDGSIRWTHWSDQAFFDPGGRLIEFQSVGYELQHRPKLLRSTSFISATA